MATFISTKGKTKAVIRKQGYPTFCKTFIKKTDALAWSKKIESEMERGLFAYARGDDIYTMLDYPGIPRAVHKKLINTLFNAKSLDSAIRALMSTHCWQCEETGKWKSETYKGKRRRKCTGKPFKRNSTSIYRVLQTKPPFSGTSIVFRARVPPSSSRWQNDADTTSLSQHVELPVIPIHDEIIVPETKATMEFAEIALKDAFRETFGAEGSFGSIYAKWSFGEGKEDKTVEIKLGE